MYQFVAVGYNWFIQNDDSGETSIVKVISDEQKSEIFNKGPQV